MVRESNIGKLLALKRKVDVLRSKHIEAENKNKYFSAWQKAAKKYYLLKDELFKTENQVA